MSAADAALVVGIPREVKDGEHRVAITPDGCEGFGDHGRGWNVAGG